MFKLLYLKLESHLHLQNIEINFVDDQETTAALKPYSSIIIGANGTGKSLILRTIVEIFRQFGPAVENAAAPGRLQYAFHIRYLVNEETYEIVTRRLTGADKKGLKRSYIAFKNRPLDVPFLDANSKLPLEKLPQYEISFKELKFPARLLASAIFINDRFPFYISSEHDFYQYLGVRRTPSATSTGTFTRKTINYLYDAAKAPQFQSNMAEMFGFLEFDPFLIINYQTRYNNIFFSGDLTPNKLEQFYEKWWEVEGVNRKKTNAPWGHWYYLQLKKERPQRLKEIVNFLNQAASNNNILLRKPNSRARNFIVDFFHTQHPSDFYPFVQDLDKLSIIVLDDIKLHKRNKEVPLAEISSGENQLILGLLGIFATIKPSSLILIDEPEISLHPNWQLQYVSLLKKMFATYGGCHFVICTHSHFLVADLENKSSAIIALEKGEKGVVANLLNGIDVYGWSAEEILYSIFKVRTVRNYFLEADLTELLGLISNNSRNGELIRMKLTAVRNVSLSVNDPLNAVIEEAEAYLREL